MEFKSINPFNNEEVGVYKGLTKDEIDLKLHNAKAAFESWRLVDLKVKAALMNKAAQILRENVDAYATMITLEMGKPIVESKAEINKCAWVCEYYAENAGQFLADEKIETDATISFVKHDPIGAVLAIMPWNFPFWQAFRFAAPTLMAGNTVLLKHAPNVFGSANLIEEVFVKAGFPMAVFQNLVLHHEHTEQVIAHDGVRAVSLTGSEKAGAAVATLAGKYLKKSLLELGGNNAFIVLADANIDTAVATAVTARMLNCGQSCIAAKRFILMEAIYEEFVSKFTEAISQLKPGDPLDVTTQIGPLARLDLAEKLQAQVQLSIAQGATLIFGGNQEACFHEATVLGNVKPGMAAFEEETFGPLAAMIKAKDIDDAFDLAGQSKYGLGTTVCTSNTALALEYAHKVSDGAYFINQLVKSDPRLPFGGTKKSGYGRELSKDGILAFVNRKTVYLK